MHGGIDNEQVLRSIDLCVGVHNNTSLALNTHLSGAHVVAAGLEVLDEISACDVGDSSRGQKRKRRVSAGGHLDQTVHHGSRRLLVSIAGHVGIDFEGCSTVRCNAEATN
jgi:hypothetical protein